MVIEYIWDIDLTRPLTKKTLIQDCYRIKLFAICQWASYNHLLTFNL